VVTVRAGCRVSRLVPDRGLAGFVEGGADAAVGEQAVDDVGDGGFVGG
jgi:hypothetical protein